MGRGERQPASPSLPQAEGRGLVRLGEFGRAHGLKGEVRLKSYTAQPEAIASYGPLRTAEGRSVRLTSVRPAPGAAPDLLIARVEGIAARNAAEALNRVALFVERDRLAAPEDSDEFLAADLVGLPVAAMDGSPLGSVVALVDYGGGDLLEIELAGDRRRVLLPFTKAFVPLVDLSAGRIAIDPPDGLFDEDTPSPRSRRGADRSGPADPPRPPPRRGT